MIPGGTSALVELRADLLRLLPARPDLAPVDADLKHLLGVVVQQGLPRA